MRFIILLICSIMSIVLCACKPSQQNALVIGTIAGPETDLLITVKKIANEKYHLPIKIVEFTDYNLPNEALADGSLDANVYQHLPYLEAAILAHHYPFKAIGKTFIYPMGIYSYKWKTLDSVPSHARVAVPNDPSNETRALILLEKAGLIQLTHQKTATLADITINTKQLEFKELDAAQLPRVLNDVDLAVINTTYALPAGLNPLKDALYREGKDSLYANLIVINTNTKKMHQIHQFIKALQTPEVENTAKQLFGDAAIPAW